MTPRWAVLLLSLAGLACGLRQGLRIADGDLDFAFEPDVEVEHRAGGGGAAHRGAHGQGQGGRGVPSAKLTQRQWGVQDTSATAGKLFRFSIPADAFSGDVDHYEAQSPSGAPLPAWLLFDQTTGLFEGVPTLKDVGTVYVTVHAVSAYNSAKDKFSIDVLPPAEAAPSAGVVPLGLASHHHPKVKCGPGEDPLILSVVMDGKYDHMKPRQRLTTIDNLSGFLSLSHDLFQLLPQNSREDILSEDSIIMAGEGNVQKSKWKQGSVIQWQVGCESQLWPQQTRIVEDLKQQARDGTLAEVLLWPVVGWHIKADNSLANRGRREAAGQNEAGSGNFAEDGATDDTEAGEAGVPDSHIVPTMSSPVYPGATATPTPFSHNFNSFTENPSQHHHRHHHGDLEPGVVPGIQEVDNPVEEFRISQPDSGPLAPYLSSSFGGGGYSLPSSPVLYGSIMPTPTLEPEKPTIHFGVGSPTPEITRVYEGVEVTPTPVFPTEVEPTTYPSPSSAGSPSYIPSSGTGNMDQSSTHVTEPMIDGTSGSSTSSSPASGSDVTIEGVETRESTEKPVTIVDISDFYDPTNMTTTGHPSTASSTAGTTPPTTTPSPPVTTTTTPATTTTEVIEIDQKNFPPTVNARLRKLPVTAGKIVKFVVPDDTFKDLEEGSTRNLRLTLKTKDGNDLDQTSWIQFNSARREILLLPLEEHVSRWFFSLEATDKEGASVSDRLEVVVQHHQHRRAVNHEITLVMEPTALIRQENVLKWEVVLVETLARLFGDPDTSQITVRHLDVAKLSTNGSVSLTYTNDSLPRTTCPHEGIQNMLKVLRRNEDGDPSQALFHALTVHAKHLNIRKVLYKGLANCEVATKPEVQPGSPISPDVARNYPPIPRNQVDHINATVGMLLSYKVPEDSFYDPEDLTTRAMKLSLLTMDHSPIPPDNWLQFDVKNQEFYGVPMPSDEGSKEYQLVCEDRGGLRAHDGLVVVVHPAPTVPYSVEFSITINPHYETFIRNTPQKRKFVEKLRELFGDSDSSNIVIGRISKGSTVITWYNRTLPTTRCPHDEISTLRRVLVNDDNQMSSRLISVMGPEFVVLAVGLYPTAVCQGELTPLHPTDPPPPPVDELPPMGSSEEYLITFVVPAVIICTMLLLAGIVACVLYRRRRTGKMSVGDEDERQSFRNKGIPVIFQDELEEQTEPINKSPVIMKEEKPPLPPPEYQRHNPSPPPTQALLSDTEDAEPYQPPPPFTTSRDTARHTRHKSTPTYRKPPPYVPP